MRLIGNCVISVLALSAHALAQGIAFTPAASANVVENFGSLFPAGVADLNGDGKPDLVVGGESGAYLMLGMGNGNFQLARKIASTATTSLAIADLNGDGQPDIIAVQPAAGILILRGHGDGTFDESLEQVPLGESLSTMAAADLNQDGIIDLAYAKGNAVAVWFGNGDGTFRAGNVYPTPRTPRKIIAADFTGDGIPDLAVAQITSSSLAFLIGLGAGEFRASTAVTVDSYAMDIAAGDFNKDGKIDLAVATQSDVRLLLGNGDATFRPGVPITVASEPVSITAGDLNGDGNLDVVSGSYYEGRIVVFQGTGDGNLRRYSEVSAPGDIFFVGLADLNSDGKPDLFATSYSASGTLAATGKGDGTFNPPAYFGNRGLPSPVLRSGDIDGDGKREIIAIVPGRKTVMILDGAANIMAMLPVNGYPLDAAIADFNMDHIADLALSTVHSLSPNSPNDSTSNIDLILGTKDRNWKSSSAVSFSGYLSAIAAADFNGDTMLDVVAADTRGGSLQVYTGRGNGSFNLGSSIPVSAGRDTPIGMLLAGDFNGDGSQDIAGIQSSGWLTFFSGQGDGQLVERSGVNVCSKPSQASVGDFNGDGRPDLAISCQAQDPSVLVLTNSENGKFVVSSEIKAGITSYYRPVPIAVGDFDKNGKDDIVVLQSSTQAQDYRDVPTAGILLLNQDGAAFRCAGLVAGVKRPTVAIGEDWDQNGRLDLVVFNEEDSTVTFHQNKVESAPVAAVTAVSAASFVPQAIAPDSIVTLFGEELSGTAEGATSLPLPTVLAGTMVIVTDASGAAKPAQLFYASPTQINFLVPSASGLGLGMITVSRGGVAVAQSMAHISNVSPAIFTANSDGKGVPAATAVRVKPDGSQSAAPVFQCGSTTGSCVPVPIDLGQPGDKVYLQLFGTGIHGCGETSVYISGNSYRPEWFGPQGQYAGLDQVNLVLPPELSGRGQVPLSMFVCGANSNEVTLNVE